MGVAFKGIEAVLRSIAHASDRMKAAVSAATYQEAAVIARESLKQAPVDTGRLRSSFYLKPPVSNDNPVVRMGYGTDYAVYVHEMIDIPHKPPTKAKFLSDPIEAVKDGWAERVAKRAADNFARGVGAVFHIGDLETGED